MENYILLFSAILLVIFFIYTKRRRNRHYRNISTGNRVIQKLNAIEHDGAKLNYLRKVNPFVFEELVLTAFSKNGYTIIRNKRYTGDGGIDGKVVKNGQLYLVQAKRYSTSINPQHVIDFNEAINRVNASGGYFVHTGRTGEKSHQNRQGNIEFISGSKLLTLISIVN